MKQVWQSSILALVLMLGLTLNLQAQRFGDRLWFSAGVHPVAMAVGDFNRDGNQDLAITGFVDPDPDFGAFNDNVQIFLGNGRGTFRFKGSHFVGTPTSMAVGDLNRDAKLDLVVSRPGPGRAAILLGNGDGSFQPSIDFLPGDPITTAPGRPVIADFDRSGSPDVAFPSGTNDTVGLGLGDKTGSLAFASSLPGGPGPVSGVAADFDQNGTQDLALSDFNGAAVAVLLGSGSGGFFGPTFFSSGGGNPETIVTADFNRDGKDDVAFANVGTAQVEVLLGDGSGSFSGPLAIDDVHVTALGNTIGVNDELLAVGDFNHDAIPDLAAVEQTKNDVLLLFGDGTGRMGRPQRYPAGSGPVVVKVADFNNDGRDDLAIADFGSSKVSILIANRD